MTRITFAGMHPALTCVYFERGDYLRLSGYAATGMFYCVDSDSDPGRLARDSSDRIVRITVSNLRTLTYRELHRMRWMEDLHVRLEDAWWRWCDRREPVWVTAWPHVEWKMESIYFGLPQYAMSLAAAVWRFCHAR